MTTTANARLQAIRSAFGTTNKPPVSESVYFSTTDWKRLLILPDGTKIEVAACEESNGIRVDESVVISFRTSFRTVSLVMSALGTPHEHKAHHVPAFSVLEIQTPSNCSIADIWAVVYALFTLYHAQETIPIIFGGSSSLTLHRYLLDSGLGRTKHVLPPGSPTGPEIFLSRAAFWQGAGTTGYHIRGWVRTSLQSQIPRPTVESFTRNARVITSHPLRPPSPAAGQTLYKRYCANVGEIIEFTAVDFDETPGGQVGEHLAAFHRWHNDDLVNKAWGEKGSLEQHRQYLKEIVADPGVLPLIMSWEGQLMGYAELVWIKEHPISQFIPEGAREYDRGPHVLVGEPKFRGANRSHAWLSSIYHFCFLADPRTDRVIGEPSATNPGILKASTGAGMYLHAVFDFPHKRSMLQFNLRDRFFKSDIL